MEEVKSVESDWVPDQSYDVCYGCLRKFTVFLRRHHCRSCGQLFCRFCSSGRAELTPGAGFVRVCDACLQDVTRLAQSHAFISNRKALPNLPPRKASLSSVHSELSVVTQPSSNNNPEAGNIPPKDLQLVPRLNPSSIFHLNESQVGMVLFIQVPSPASQDDVHPIGNVHPIPFVAIAGLCPTLSCRCFRRPIKPTPPVSIQSTHFEFPLQHVRARLDLPFSSSPEGPAVGFTLRLQTFKSTFIGTGTARILPGPRMLRVVDEFSVKCFDPKTGSYVVACGSIAWRLSSGNDMEMKENTDENDSKTDVLPRSEVYQIISEELAKCFEGLNEAKEEEDQHRTELDHLSQQVESVKITSHNAVGSKLDVKTVSDLKSDVSGSSKSPSDLASLRRRRNVHWEAVHRLLSRRNELQVRIGQLRLMQTCLDSAKDSQVTHSIICHKCRGTLSV
jgi:hypothetical protein